jgi:uncharacterized Zn finger protein (UPF0148 family)
VGRGVRGFGLLPLASAKAIPMLEDHCVRCGGALMPDEGFRQETRGDVSCFNCGRPVYATAPMTLEQLEWEKTERGPRQRRRDPTHNGVLL